MNTPAVFRGSYSDLKVVRSRSVVQVVIEIPIEQSAGFVAAFGMPQPGAEVPVALALMKPESKADKPKQHWSQMLRSQRAGIRCSDLKFQLWMSKRYPRADCDTAELVRRFCNVKSRADLNEDRDAAERFDKLDAQFLMDTGQLAEVRS